jgi:hypothetical protein
MELVCNMGDVKPGECGVSKVVSFLPRTGLVQTVAAHNAA